MQKISSSTLPVHPTKRHPITGEPIQAIWVTPAGKVCWPVIGAAPEDGEGAGDGSGQDEGSGSGAGTGAGSGGSGGTTNAADAAGNDLGFPKETPVAEMNDKQQAAYWRHNARKHEGRVKDLVGDRKPEDIKKDLEAYQQLQREQQTPAEQALTARFDEGKSAGVQAERRSAATAIFRGALESGGINGDDLDELTSSFAVDGFITDAGIDTTKISNFAKRLITPGKGDQQERRRDFGAGSTRGGSSTRSGGGSVAQVMADRAAARANKSTTSTS